MTFPPLAVSLMYETAPSVPSIGGTSWTTRSRADAEPEEGEADELFAMAA